ncbi:hypothetical protein JDV02_008935 [Purpureocillium takamizusanense]|uniref:Uncharacterized protein n=1 Tax=Purpureocillium takamizusanense TaxID=2060973 RepID=A0A9Q8QPV1_9HYPO|nr:uncharacterized protein JDV02_008935 [Purpureocillium takamizusanense]UNI23096.1 hypothetical protein JDV02_008935 [Purpureocillium takamizusanense]
MSTETAELQRQLASFQCQAERLRAERDDTAREIASTERLIREALRENERLARQLGRLQERFQGRQARRFWPM